MFLGIDIGTQSLKAILTDADLRPLGSGSVAYRASYPAADRAEQDPALWLSALGPAIAAALSAASADPGRIRAMAITGQLDGCIGVTATGAPVGRAIIWSDRRAEGALAGLDADLVHDRAGLVRDPTHMGAKIRWCKRHLEGTRDVACWHQPVSFMVERLTGARVMDPALASTTMLFGLAAGTWDDTLLAAFGIDRRELPEIAPAASVAGRMTPAGAALSGLPAGLPVAVGTGDDFANPLGAGIAAPGTVAVTLGTGEAISALSELPLRDPDRLVETRAFPTGHFSIGNPGWLSGGAITWFLDTFSVADATVFSRLAAEAPPGSDGLLFLPALSGAMAPLWRPSARACFVGATTSHGKAHFARAVLEGTSHAMRDVIDRLDRIGVDTGRIRLMGGGAASPVWAQIRADLLRRAVETIADDTDASALGAAVLAAVAGRGARDIAEACSLRDPPLRVTEPQPENQAAQQDAYDRYRSLFAALEPIFP
jgi:xylulokinase